MSNPEDRYFAPVEQPNGTTSCSPVIACPCGGRFVVMAEQGEDGSTLHVMHREPVCSAYAEMNPDVFIVWARGNGATVTDEPVPVIKSVTPIPSKADPEIMN